MLAQTRMPFAAFKRQLRNPINDMPPYPENLLSEKEAADIFAYLQSLPGRRPVKDFPILNNDDSMGGDAMRITMITGPSGWPAWRPTRSGRRTACLRLYALVGDHIPEPRRD